MGLARLSEKTNSMLLLLFPIVSLVCPFVGLVGSCARTRPPDRILLSCAHSVIRSQYLPSVKLYDTAIPMSIAQLLAPADWSVACLVDRSLDRLLVRPLAPLLEKSLARRIAGLSEASGLASEMFFFRCGGGVGPSLDRSLDCSLDCSLAAPLARPVALFCGDTTQCINGSWIALRIFVVNGASHTFCVYSPFRSIAARENLMIASSKCSHCKM